MRSTKDGRTKNVSATEHDITRRLKKAKQQQAAKAAAAHKRSSNDPRYQTANARRLQAVARTMDALTIKLRAHIDMLEVCEIFLAKYTAAKPATDKDGRRQFPIELAEHRTHEDLFGLRSPQLVNAAIKAARVELGYQLNLV